MRDYSTVLKADVAVAMLAALKACEAQGVGRMEIARRARCAHLKHVLGGRENLTLETIANVAHAMGLRARLVFEPLRAGTPVRPKAEPAAAPSRPTYHSMHAMIARAELAPVERGHGRHLRASTAKQLLHALVELSDQWVAGKTIEARAGVKATIVRDGLPALERAGLVRIERRGTRGLPRGAARLKYILNFDTLRKLGAGKESAA